MNPAQLVETLTEYGLGLLEEAKEASDDGPTMTERIKLLDSMTRLAALAQKDRKNEPGSPGIDQYRGIFTPAADASARREAGKRRNGARSGS